MAKYVREIMNGELFAVEPDAPRQDTLDFLLMLGVSGCPVIDEAGKLSGIVTVRDLFPDVGGQRVRDRITSPAVTIAHSATVEEAGRKLTEHQAHRLIVQDEKGRAVGLVSAVDLVAALVGAPVSHPKVFPHTDASGEVEWSDPVVLEPEQGEQVPNAAGVLVLIYAGRGTVDMPVWVESANNLRARFDDLCSSPQEQAALAYLLKFDHGHLHCRFATAEDPDLRLAAVERVRSQMRRHSPLGF